MELGLDFKLRSWSWNWEGFGRYPVFTTVFTGKYRPGKNRIWTPKVGKTWKNTTQVFLSNLVHRKRLNQTLKFINTGINFSYLYPNGD